MRRASLRFESSPDKIREIIGPAAKVIRGIIEADRRQDGRRRRRHRDDRLDRCSGLPEGRRDGASGSPRKPRSAKYTKAPCARSSNSARSLRLLPGTDGLVHISQLAPERVRKVTDVLKEGDEVMVKVLEIDKQGKIRLSRKEALAETGGGSG